MARYEQYETCGVCGGEGSIERSEPQHDDPYYAVVTRCDECNGSGIIWNGGGPTEKRRYSRKQRRVIAMQRQGTRK